MPDRQDQAGLLSQRDKVSRRHHAPYRMPPAQQRFCTDNAPVIAGLRLVIQHQLIARQRLAQFRFHDIAFGQVGLHDP
ncbi:hypothetical protein D3C81_1571110 [compost metagenome]